MKYLIVEKQNQHAVHAHCDTKEGAERYLKETVPLHVKEGYYVDKTLTADSFEIREEKL
jgi:hypothetical protein